LNDHQPMAPPHYREFAEFLARPARHQADPTGPGLVLGAVGHVTCTI
jgi:hypothetical protein